MPKRRGIRKTITGGKIQDVFNLVDVVDTETGKVVKKAVAVDIEEIRSTQTGEVVHRQVTPKPVTTRT